jgi:hypothetical protein
MTHSTRSTVTLLSALVAVACALPAFAQEGASGGPPAMTCQNPGLRPLDSSSPEGGKFQKKLDEFKKCVADYSQTNGARANEIAAQSRATAAKADELAVQSRAYSDAANKAVNDFNSYVTEVNQGNKDASTGKGPSASSAPKY